MYLIKAKDNFINIISDLSLKDAHTLTNSIISAKKIPNEQNKNDDKTSFLDDLLETIKNQEKE